ncbi:MAG: GDSL-type esterase/lipase family protein [Planctomycetota bacterium]
MSKRLLFLIALLIVVSGVATVVYRKQHHLRVNPFAKVVGITGPDAFDTPYDSDASLVALFAQPPGEFPFKSGDRVAFVGSSSTYIGVWTKTVEFLLRSRHPDVDISFSRHSTGGGTYATCAERLPDWLERSHPTLVFFNYGANDSYGGKEMIGELHEAISLCSQLAQKSGARVVHITPQSGDIRKSGSQAYFRRKRYADDMLMFCKTNGHDIVDTHHPLEDLQLKMQGVDATFSMNTDSVHLTDAAYVAWGFFMYDRLNPLHVESALHLDATSKRVVSSTRCSARILDSDAALCFERVDEVLPVLPPSPLPVDQSRTMLASYSNFSELASVPHDSPSLPPRQFVPLEKRSAYRLKIDGLAAGMYVLECNGKPSGRATAAELAAGVNLVALCLDAGIKAPWEKVAAKLWNGARLKEIDDRNFIYKLMRIDADR